MGQVRNRVTALTRLAADMPRAARTRHPPPRERHPHPPNKRRSHPPRQRPRPGASSSAWCPPQQYDCLRFTFCFLGEPSAAVPSPPPRPAKPRSRDWIDDPFATWAGPKRVPSANSGAVAARGACMVGPVTRVEKDCLVLKFDRLILESAIHWTAPGRPVCTRVPKERRCGSFDTTYKRLLRASNQRKSRALVLSGAIH